MTENERKRSEKRMGDESTGGADQKESQEVDAKMETQSSSTDEPLDWDELMTFSLEELEELLLHIYAILGEIFHEINGYAQGATQIEAQFEKLVGLEKHYKKVWEDMKVTVRAIIGHVFFSDQCEEEWKKLAPLLREDMAFLQAVTSGTEITSEWLAQRDALAAQTASLVEGVREEAVRQCKQENRGAFLLLLEDVGLIPLWKPSNSRARPRS
jgi:hypothetical protein